MSHRCRPSALTLLCAATLAFAGCATTTGSTAATSTPATATTETTQAATTKQAPDEGEAGELPPEAEGPDQPDTAESEQAPAAGPESAAPSASEQPAPATTSAIVVTNTSDLPLCAVYVSPSNGTTWGPNRLDADERIAPGTTRTWSITTGTWDFRLMDCKGQVAMERRGVTIAGRGVVVTFRGAE
ncbi:MAG: hypothetical protein KC543_15390 [Myxococcales bacterium]|nr:hypothetical protein [Myxococcales bacterium]